MNRPRHTRPFRPLPEGVRIVHEDRDILVADKPAGLLTMATETEKRRTLYSILFDELRRRRPPQRLFIVHRLDREASGLIVFAKSEPAKHQLQDQFKDHSAGRTYLAVTEGRMDQDQLTVDSFLAENAAHRCYSTRDTVNGKRAITHVRVLARTATRTWVEVKLETGRKHQIRVHLAEQGHPILGDPVYGTRKSSGRRLALHGMKLSFKHPATGQTLTFDSPISSEPFLFPKPN